MACFWTATDSFDLLVEKRSFPALPVAPVRNEGIPCHLKNPSWSKDELSLHQYLTRKRLTRQFSPKSTALLHCILKKPYNMGYQRLSFLALFLETSERGTTNWWRRAIVVLSTSGQVWPSSTTSSFMLTVEWPYLSCVVHHEWCRRSMTPCQEMHGKEKMARKKWSWA